MTTHFPQSIWRMGFIARVRVFRAMLRIRNIYTALIIPKHKDTDTRRRELVLNYILVITIGIFVLLALTIIYNIHVHADTYSGISLLVFVVIIALYIGLLVLSRKGFVALSSNILIATNIIGTIYTGWTWGASLPATLLLTALVIVTTSALRGSKSGFIISIIMICTLATLGIHEAQSLNIPSWRYDEISLTDVIAYSILFMFISMIAWLSNREIDNSLQEARRAKDELEVERNELEIRVADRTKQLKQKTEDYIRESEHIVQIGKLSQGILHDLMQPLSTISLVLENVKDTPDTYRHMQRIIDSSRRLNEYISSVRKHISPQRNTLIVNILDEINTVCDILRYKARLACVDIGIHTDCKAEQLTLSRINPVHIYQIILNLVTNSIHACEENSTPDVTHKIDIHIKTDDSHMIIAVHDTGCGMSEECLHSINSRASVTSKTGSGIGLSHIHTVIHEILQGTLSFKPNKPTGTICTVTLPKQKKKD